MTDYEIPLCPVCGFPSDDQEPTHDECALEVARVLAHAKDLGVDETGYDLEEAVQEALMEEAESINGGGLETQVIFFLERYGEEQTKEILRGCKKDG